MHAAAAQWLLDGGSPASRTSLREPASRAFAPALALGTLSPRRILAESTRVSLAPLSPADAPLWSRSDLGCLTDVAEWREWQRLHAARELDEVAQGERSDCLKATEPAVRYWRWGGQHLCRYMAWESHAGEGAEVSSGLGSVQPTSDSAANSASNSGSSSGSSSGSNPEQMPAIVFVHGFAASSEQWSRLVGALRSEAGDTPLPPMYALDLLGFGHSEAPGLSYTQHLWEAQLVDFVLEVLQGRPVVLVGNSIGGGLSAGGAANMGSLCRGLVLCNTAGVIKDPEEYRQVFTRPCPFVTPNSSHLSHSSHRSHSYFLIHHTYRQLRRETPKTVGEMTLRGELTAPYEPLPLGPPLLEAFGAVVIAALKPRIPDLLKSYYPTNPEAADARQAATIARDAGDPGAANVIGSGQKLPPQRSLNEVLGAADGFSGPVLVPQGALDPLTSPKRAQLRAAQLGELREGVRVKLLQAGHCPHDEVPTEVAREIIKWWPEVVASK